MTAEAFDFRKPPRTTLEGKTVQWLKEACGIAPRVWPKILTFQAELVFDEVTSIPAIAGIEKLPFDAVAFRLNVQGYPGCEPILAIPRPLLLALINGSLGVPPKELPPDRELSTVENSVCNFLINQLILDLLGGSWPAAQQPKFTIVARGEPRGVSTLPPNDLIVQTRLLIRGPFGDHPIMLIMPRSAPLTELVKPSVDPVPIQPAAKEQIEALVTEMSVDFLVNLGSTQITLLQMAMLKPGDLVILNQKVGEPLQAKISGKEKFSVWPGAVGRRQAVQIENLIEK